ncbi:MAG: hypothetical protein H0T45_14560 [Pyrinomonadaceae bacterium]|nr:hypothetical protein [Pyrinomonadaceae bacterium]MDQ3133211.1 hypothetical protein [Acidobacteriota bacterium]
MRNSSPEIEHFFILYNEIKGKKFEPLGRYGPERAPKLVEEGIKLFRREHGNGRGSMPAAKREAMATKQKR